MSLVDQVEEFLSREEARAEALVDAGEADLAAIAKDAEKDVEALIAKVKAAAETVHAADPFDPQPGIRAQQAAMLARTKHTVAAEPVVALEGSSTDTATKALEDGAEFQEHLKEDENPNPPKLDGEADGSEEHVEDMSEHVDPGEATHLEGAGADVVESAPDIPVGEDVK
jgi:hypothetical protein